MKWAWMKSNKRNCQSCNRVHVWEWNKDGFQGYHLGRLAIFHVNDVVSALGIPNSRRLHGTGMLSLPLVSWTSTFYNQLANEFRRTELRKILGLSHKSSLLVDTKKTVTLRQLVIRHQVQKPKVASNLCTWKRKLVKLCEAVGYVDEAEYIYRHTLQWNELWNIGL